MDSNSARGPLAATAWTMGLRMGGLPLQFLAFVVVARLHDIHDTGIFAISNAVWQLARQMGPLGLDQAALRLIPKFLADGRHREAEAFVGATRDWVLRVALASAAVVAMAAAVAGAFGAGTHAAASALLFGALGIPAFASHGLQVGVLRAQQRVRAAQIPESILSPALASLGAWLGYQIGPGTIEVTLLAFVTTAYGVALAYRVLLGPRRGGTRELGAAAEEIRATAAKMFAGQALNAVASRAPVLLLPIWAGPAGAAMMETASRVGQLASVPTWAAGIAASPLFSDAATRGDREGLQRTLHVATWAALVPASTILLGVALGGSTALSWIGDEYRIAWAPTVVLCGASAINAALGLGGTLLYMSGREGIVLVANAFALAVVAAGVVCFAPTLGVLGAALAVAVATAVRDGWLTMTASRMVQVAPTVFSRSGWRALARMVAQVPRAVR